MRNAWKAHPMELGAVRSKGLGMTIFCTHVAVERSIMS